MSCPYLWALTMRSCEEESPADQGCDLGDVTLE